MRIKISQMPFEIITDNDLIPFVKVPITGVKTNQKITFADFKSLIGGSSVELVRTEQVDENESTILTFGFIQPTLVPFTSPVTYDSGYLATFTNTSSEEKGYEYSQHLHVTAVIRPQGLRDPNNRVLKVRYQVITSLFIEDQGEWVSNYEEFTDYYFLITAGEINLTYDRTYYSATMFKLPANKYGTVRNSIVILEMQYASGNQIIPNGVTDLFTIRVVDNMHDTSLNTKIFS